MTEKEIAAFTPQKIKLKADEILVTIPLRSEKNEDRIFQFTRLLEEGHEFTPIIVAANPNNARHELIDGRLRLAAYKLSGIKEVECEVIELGEEFWRIAAAMNSQSNEQVVFEEVQ